jgi:hypothetical protein
VEILDGQIRSDTGPGAGPSRLNPEVGS